MIMKMMMMVMMEHDYERGSFGGISGRGRGRESVME
jgi:hypothetical protein